MNPQEIPQTQKTPEAYDLSKVEDLGKLSNGLTLDERKALREKFVQEKEAIIYLTQSELTELQTTLVSENNPHSDRVERVASFLESQKSEGLALSDFIPQESIFAEQIKNTEKLVSEALFGNPGILKDMNLSDTARNIFAAGMSLAIIEEMGKNPSGIDIAKLKQNPPDMSSLETLAQKMLPLAILSSQKESIGVGSIQVPKLYISGNGDTNTLFQNPLEAQKLITGMLSGEITQENLEAYIERKNDTPASNIDTQMIQEHLAKNLGAIESQLKNAQTAQDPETAAQEAAAEIAPDASEEEKQSILEAFLKLFKEFVDGFIGVGEKVFGPIESKTGNDEAPDTENTPDETVLTVNGKKIAIKHAWVQEQIGNVVQDTQKPTQTEILGILKQFQNSDFSNPKNQPENSAQAIYALQVALSNQGIDLGDIDGVFGPKTQEGIKQYQKNLGLSETGKIDEGLFSTLIKKIVPETPEK